MSGWGVRFKESVIKTIAWIVIFGFLVYYINSIECDIVRTTLYTYISYTSLYTNYKINPVYIYIYIYGKEISLYKSNSDPGICNK